ncbi:MAG: HD domain-containing protein [Planctomycetota bacterium]
MDLVQSLLALSRLDALPRTGWVQAGVPVPESLAGHSLAVTHLALALLPRVTPGLDLGRVLAMATLHDGPECLSGGPAAGGRPRPAGWGQGPDGGVLARELLEPLGPVAHAAWREFAAQETREARFVKGCDRVQLALEVLRLARAGLGISVRSCRASIPARRSNSSP